MVYTIKATGKEELANAWGTTSAMDQRVKFIADWLSNDYSKIELCVAYGISRIARRVRYNGEIKWHGDLIYVSQVLALEPVGLSQINEEQWESPLWFSSARHPGPTTKKVKPPKGWHGAKFTKT